MLFLANADANEHMPTNCNLIGCIKSKIQQVVTE